MSFERANIDRAIVMTQHDLRGFVHPLGIRTKMPNAKMLDAATGNLLSFAVGRPTPVGYTDYFSRTYEQSLQICKDLAFSCDGSQKEAIRLIVQEIVRQQKQLVQEEAAGTRNPSKYLQPLERGCRFGNTVLALQEAFGPFVPVTEGRAA